MLIRIVGWMVGLSELLLAINLITLLVAVFAKRFRRTAGGLLFAAIWAWGLTLIVWCAVRVFFDHGPFLTIFGLLMGGVGIVPVAFLSLLVEESGLICWNCSFRSPWSLAVGRSPSGLSLRNRVLKINAHLRHYRLALLTRIVVH